MKTHKRISPMLLILCLTVLVGCVPQQDIPTQPLPQKESDAGNSLHIVTTFPPLYAHVANLVDENDTVTNLVPPGTSVHFRQPKPSDIVAMEQADIIVMNGLGLEEFLEDHLHDLEAQGVMVVDTSKGITPMQYGGYEEDDEDKDEHDEEDRDEHNEGDNGHAHEGDDPHIRLDPANAQIQVANILQALITADPAQAQWYTKQVENYTADIGILQTTITERFETQETAPFVVFHDAYQYFLHAFGLADAQVGLVQEFHGDNPSQRQIAELITTIETHDVQIIYTEPQFSPSVVERLEQETGVKQKEVDPIGSLLDANGYITMMTKLAEAFSNK